MALDPPRRRRVHAVTGLAASLLVFAVLQASASLWRAPRVHAPPHAHTTLVRCAALHARPEPPADAHSRRVSDRFERGTRPHFIRVRARWGTRLVGRLADSARQNATIWTGGDAGREVVVGDVLLDQGLVVAVGAVGGAALEGLDDLVVIDAGRAWVTPG
jgi:hypothetical protein